MRRRAFLGATTGLVAAGGCVGLDGNGTATPAATPDGDRPPLAVTIDGTSVSTDVDGADWPPGADGPVTVAAALDRLPQFGYRRDGWRAVTVDGTTYDERERSVETAFRVDGALVDPEAATVRAVDAVELAITTTGAVTDEDGDSPVDAAGEIALVVDGAAFDLSRNRFQAEGATGGSLAFHLHRGDDSWYMEGDRRVTAGRGIDLLPNISYRRVDGFHVLDLDGTTYHERAAGTEVAFLVDGALVDPTAFELADGDELRVEVATGS